MVAALNCWWPDGQIFRSTNGGATWSPLWSFVSYPTMNKYYTYSDSLAPWLGPNYVDTTPGNKQIGWMMEGEQVISPTHASNDAQFYLFIYLALVINPFDSNHWLYGTGATVYGGHDLLKVCLVVLYNTRTVLTMVLLVGHCTQCHNQIPRRWNRRNRRSGSYFTPDWSISTFCCRRYWRYASSSIQLIS